MRLAVIGAAGRIGSRIVAEAGARGHEVTAVVRDGAGVAAAGVAAAGVAAWPHRVAEADVFDPAAVARAATGADVVVNAAGHAAQLDDVGFYTRAATSVVSALRTLTPRPRLIVVGGFGSLRGPDGRQYADRADLPARAAPEITGQRDALSYYRDVDDLRWAYLSPPPGGITPGRRTGTYTLALDTPGDREPATTLISMEDYAVAVIDEAELLSHAGACVAVMAYASNHDRYLGRPPCPAGCGVMEPVVAVQSEGVDHFDNPGHPRLGTAQVIVYVIACPTCGAGMYWKFDHDCAGYPTSASYPIEAVWTLPMPADDVGRLRDGLTGCPDPTDGACACPAHTALKTSQESLAKWPTDPPRVGAGTVLVDGLPHLRPLT